MRGEPCNKQQLPEAELCLLTSFMSSPDGNWKAAENPNINVASFEQVQYNCASTFWPFLQQVKIHTYGFMLLLLYI